VPKQRSQPPAPRKRPDFAREREKAEKKPSGPELRSEQVAIVLLGAFNPSIFQPWWMVHQGLIDEEEAESAEVGIVHPEVVSFKTGPISIEVTRDRFQAQTEDATAVEALRDLVIGSFARLSHTPIAAMGVNRSTHHQMPTRESWNEIGHKLLPKEPWNDILREPGTRNLTVEGKRPDDQTGYIRAIFEPSAVVEHGIFQMVNDHFQFNDGDPKKNIRASEAMDVLAETWDASLARAQEIVERILSYA